MASKQINFTKETIESIAPPQKGYETYKDGGSKKSVPGLIMRVQSSGTKVFYLSRWINAKSEFVWIGRFPATHPETAREEAEKLNAEITLEKNPAEEKRCIRAEMTLGELFAQYLEKHAKKHKKTWKYDEQMFDNYFSHWKNRKISTITRKEVHALHSHMGDENGKYQANRAFAMFRTLFEKAREWDYEGDNPCFKLKKFKEESRERRLESEECEAFFKAVMAEKNEMEQDFMLMLLYTGARKSNVMGMAWENISLDMKVWKIPAAQSKNGYAYTVPLITPALEILVRRKKGNNSPWVFHSPESESGHLEEEKRAWTRMLKASKLKDFRPHDLRRSLATWMLATDSSAMLADYALGHKLASQGITAVYAREDIEAIRAGMERAVRAMLRKGKVIPEEGAIIEFKQA